MQAHADILIMGPSLAPCLPLPILSHPLPLCVAALQTAYTALLRLPSPLPGVSTPEQLQPLLAWAYQLLCSPRLREADAGE